MGLNKHEITFYLKFFLLESSDITKEIQFNCQILGFRFMVFNNTFNNISVISQWSFLLVEETRVPGENHRPVAGH